MPPSSRSRVRASTVEERLSKLAPEERAHVEANSRWLPIYPWSEWIAHPSAPGGGFTVNKEFYNWLVEFMEDHRGIYYAPITANHDHGPAPEREGTVPDSAKNFGRVITLREAKDGIEAYTYFARGVAQDYDDGYIDSISPTHYNGFHSNGTGKHYMTGLKEVSIVRIRHQKGLKGASPWYKLEEQEQSAVALTEIEEQPMPPVPTPATPPTSPTPTPTSPTPTPAATQTPAGALTAEAVQTMINSSVTPLSEQLNTVLERLPKPPPAPTDPPTSETRLSELEGQLKLYQARDRVRAAVPGLDDATVTKLSEAVMAAPGSFDVIIGAHKELATLKAKPPVPSTSLGEQTPGGTPTPPTTQNGTATMTYEMAVAEARAAKIAPGADTIAWVRTKYPALKKG